MKNRIKQLRKELTLTQQTFADRLGVKRNTVGQWECGINPLTEQTILSICREFNVNENWLRTGEGDMFIELSREDEIVDFIGNLLRNKDNSFKKRFVAGLATLDDDVWDILEAFFDLIQDKKY